MTQEEKQLLLKDLSGRLPYGVKVHIQKLDENKIIDNEDFDYMWLGVVLFDNPYHQVKPYLRPMSSMTEEEEKQLNAILPCGMSFTYTTREELIIYTDSEYDGDHYFSCFVEIQDWLNAHHFDYRGLIEKGLALEAKEGTYKN